MKKKSFNYIFIDESGDPGKPFKINNGEKIPTGASFYYILSAVCLNSKQLFLLENEIVKIKNEFNYKKEIKSTDVSLPLYKSLLEIINKLNITTYYRLIDKRKYKGKFAVNGKKKLHNVFDEYNLAKLTKHSVEKCGFSKTEIIIDRTDRRLLDGKFDNFNDYLIMKTNTKTIEKISHITHVNSEYVNAMQLSDLISGALKDYITKRNIDLKKVINKKLLVKIY